MASGTRRLETPTSQLKAPDPSFPLNEHHKDVPSVTQPLPPSHQDHSHQDDSRAHPPAPPALKAPNLDLLPHTVQDVSRALVPLPLPPPPQSHSNHNVESDHEDALVSLFFVLLILITVTQY